MTKQTAHQLEWGVGREWGNQKDMSLRPHLATLLAGSVCHTSGEIKVWRADEGRGGEEGGDQSVEETCVGGRGAWRCMIHLAITLTCEVRWGRGRRTALACLAGARRRRPSAYRTNQHRLSGFSDRVALRFSYHSIWP